MPPETKKKHKEIAEVIYMLHGAKASDPKFKQGIEAILKGITSSHAGALIRFSDQDLFEKYVKDKNIPYTISNEDGQIVYNIEVNFGPNGVVSIGDTKDKGILYSAIEAYLSNTFLTPVNITAKGRQILDVDRNTVKSKLLSFFTTTFDMGPTSNIQTSLMPKTLKENSTPMERNKAFKIFAHDLERAEAKHIADPANSTLMHDVDAAFLRLRSVLAPQMPMPQFKGEINKFMTLGTEPDQTITTKLVRAGSGQKGFEIESMLQFLGDAKNLEPYNLLLNNCAHFLRNMYKASANEPELKKALDTSFFSEEHILGAIASLVSPHGKLTDRFKQNDVCTPVSLARMILALQANDLHEANALQQRISLIKDLENLLKPVIELQERASNAKVADAQNVDPNTIRHSMLKGYSAATNEQSISAKHAISDDAQFRRSEPNPKRHVEMPRPRPQGSQRTH